jgi:hypothetical protein
VHAAHEARDPLVAGEPLLVRLGAAEEAARLEEEGVEALRVAAVGVEERERAQAGADAGGSCGRISSTSARAYLALAE